MRTHRGTPAQPECLNVITDLNPAIQFPSLTHLPAFQSVTTAQNSLTGLVWYALGYSDPVPYTWGGGGGEFE
jgi:hypothetical protein